MTGSDSLDVRGLNLELEAGGLKSLDDRVAAKFVTYQDLILRWNARMNLTAIRSPEGIVSRHFRESIACAQVLPQGIASLLDLGSGAGFPGVPIALCRPEISVTLAESQGKKAAFLREVSRVLDLPLRVFAERAENLDERFDCVTIRAVDRMEGAIAAGSNLVASGGFLAVLTTEADRHVLDTAAPGFTERTIVPIRGSAQRILVLLSKP
jgi:16S rRNA (guanine527-N7)-methyltransferase